MESFMMTWLALTIVLSFAIIALRDKHKSLVLKDVTIPVSVVVPFRNEKPNLKELIESLLQKEPVPGDEFIFVNDHSNDGGELIPELSNPNLTVLHLDEFKKGKKAALNKGIDFAKNEWIVTVDADCRIDSDYLQEMRNNMIEDADMLIARVFPDRGSNLVLKILDQYEYYLLGVLSQITAMIRLPLLASGAAMAFRKSAWRKIGRYRSHVQYSSGDDIYLLRDFYLNKYKIKAVVSRNAYVFTNAASSLNEWVHQKLRWAGKQAMYPDLLRKFLGLFFLIHLFILIPFLFMEWKIALFIVFIEIFLLIQFSEMPGKKLNMAFAYGFLFRFIYPILIVFLFLASRRKLNWKGRSVKK